MKHKYLSKRYWKDNSTPMGASNAKAKEYNDVINLSLGDPDIVTDRMIIERAYRDALAGHTKYTEFRGDPELRAAISKFYKEEYDMDVADDEIFVTAGGCVAMYLVMEAILDDGDEVILQSPFFTPYPQQVKLARGIPVELPTYEEEDWQVSTERLESLITERTKAIVINSPSNPTGSCLSLETMKEIARIVEKYDLIVVCDDIYTAFSYQNPFIPFASLPGMRERCLIINTVSKNFTMTGWRIGNIIAPSFLIKVIQAINENLVFTAPAPNQRAAIEAYEKRHEFQPAMVEEYRKRVFYAAERINSLRNMHVIYPPKGSFYLFINIKDTGLSSVEVADLILDQAHVLMLPGIAFGGCGEGFLRIACTVDCETLGEVFDRVGKMDLFNPELRSE
ncbi:MAG: aminotransferase class I/II-fold pyridoxal phosphate-dependent enzyme [Mogibacterium sp.]|nr:aminotransferase class I/II-fold pyridoxal phosphate-dependent enzyme [Mogibacterium sp.]